MTALTFVCHMRTAILGFLLLLSLQVQAARPTVNASNFVHTYLTCGSVFLKWSNGNGNARLIVVRQGGPVLFTPTDNTIYTTTSSDFGLSNPVGTNEYIVYNGTGSGSIAVANLATGTSYHFAIYEHDNNGNSTQYLLVGCATYSVTTYSVSQNFSINVIDSCEGSNRFIFTNTSSTSIPGLQYTFTIDGKKYNADQPLNYSFQNKNGHLSVVLTNNNTYGCPSYLNKYVKVFPKKLLTFDFLNSSDTVQDFINHRFNIRTSPKIAPFPMSVTFDWQLGDGNVSNFSTLRYSYKDVGRYHTRLIATAGVNLNPTACRDTLYLDLVVTGINPFRTLSITPDRLPLKNNLFSFSLNDTGLSAVKWYFGDGYTSTDSVTTHSYVDSGYYTVKVVATTKAGISDSTFKILRVDPDTGDTTSLNIDKVAVLSAYPVPASKHIDIQFRNIEHYQIKLFQMDGKICFEKTQTELKERLQIGDLASGNYHLSIYQNGKMVQIFNIIIDK